MKKLKKPKAVTDRKVFGDEITIDNLGELQHLREMLDAKENLVIEKALESNNPSEIVKAARVVKIKQNSLEKEENKKAVFFDPFNEGYKTGDYRNRPSQISYTTLMDMARAPVINSIIKTRQQQVSAFARPQMDDVDTGFVIKKRRKFSERGQDVKLNKEDHKWMDMITEMILECGVDKSWGRDGFDTFLRKGVKDSLTFDQLNFEIVRNKLGQPYEFIMVDGATIRVADTYSDEEAFARYGKSSDKIVGGHFPSYVQVLHEKVQAEFYPWELCFGVRNPSSRISSRGYGRSELEDMITLVTSMLNADQYNQNFFKNGSSPKGLLKTNAKGGGAASGNLGGLIGKMNQKAIREFKQAWRAMASGVHNAHNIPVLNADMDWIDLQKANRDMEFSHWVNYLVRLACALYTISPREIGFDFESEGGSFNRDSGSKNQAQIQHSKDKGLKPLLRFFQFQINRYFVSQIHPEYYMEFVGLDSEDEKERRERMQTEVSYYKTINEVREESNLSPLENGDFIMNSIYTGKMQQDAMMEQQQGMGDGMDEQAMGEGGEEDMNEFGDIDLEKYEQGEVGQEKPKDEDPIEKSFIDYFDKYLSEDANKITVI